MTIIRKIQTRRDTAANWTSANPVLLNGEVGLETDTGKEKTGNGVTAWTSLVYSRIVSTGSYANPSWITELSYAKLTGVPSTFAPSPHNHTGEEITSGTVAIGRLPSSVARLDQAQTFAGNQRIDGVLSVNTDVGGVSGLGLSLGSTSTYRWIQSFNALPLFLNPLGNSIIFPTNVWILSGDNLNRIHFQNSGTTFIQGHGATPFKVRNGDHTDVVEITSAGNITATGQLDLGARLAIIPATTTNAAYQQFENAGGALYFGIDSSTGGLSGAAYSGVINYSGTALRTIIAGATQTLLTSTGLTLTGDMTTTGYVSSGNGVFDGPSRNVGFGNVSGTMTFRANGVDAEMQLLAGGALMLNNGIWHKSAEGQQRLYFGNGGISYYQSATSHVFRSGAGTDLVEITASGSIGIGLTPGYKLDVSFAGNGTIARFAGLSGTQIIYQDAGGGGILTPALSGWYTSDNQSYYLASGAAKVTITNSNGNITATGTGTLGIYSVATLPSAAANPYSEANVNDGLAPTIGSTVVGGGAVKTKVRSNSTDWTVCGI